MANKLVRVPEVVYTPAVPPIPPTPEYCVTFTRRVEREVCNGYWGWKPYVYLGPKEGWLYVWTFFGSCHMEWVDEPYEVCYPAIPGRPGIPPKVDTRNLYGWNGGATSFDTLTPPGYAEATFPPRASGSSLGLVFEPVAFRSLEAQEFAVMAKGDYVSALRRGVSEWSLYRPAYRRYQLLVDGGRRVDLYGAVDPKKPEFVHLYRFNDAVPDGVSTLYADGLVYTVSDYLDDPAINRFLTTSADVSLGARLWRASDHTWITDSITVAGVPLVDGKRHGGCVFNLSLGVEASTAVWHYTRTAVVSSVDVEAGERAGVFAAQRLPALLGLGAYHLRAGGSAQVPPVSLKARMGPVVESQTAGLYALIPPMTFFGLGRDVNTGGMRARLPGLLCKGLPSQTVAEGNCILNNRWSLLGSARRNDDLEAGQRIVAADYMDMVVPQLFVVMDGLEVSSTASLVVVLDVEALDGVLLEEGRGIEYLVELLARERVYVNSDAASAQREALQYAVSLAGGALSEYRGFDFEGFVRTPEESYGWRRDGIYRIGGATDDGALIDALVDFGTTDYGDARLKRISAAYLGLRSDGEVYLRVRADDGRERRYRVSAAHNEKRAWLSKGMAGRYWSLSLEIEQGSFADLDNMELEVGVSQRRLTGRRR